MSILASFFGAGKSAPADSAPAPVRRPRRPRAGDKPFYYTVVRELADNGEWEFAGQFTADSKETFAFVLDEIQYGQRWITVEFVEQRTRSTLLEMWPSPDGPLVDVNQSVAVYYGTAWWSPGAFFLSAFHERGYLLGESGRVYVASDLQSEFNRLVADALAAQSAEPSAAPTSATRGRTVSELRKEYGGQSAEPYQPGLF